MPFWHVTGYALGAAPALLGREGAMACTGAAEEVVDRHYARQEQTLGDAEPELREKIRAFRSDELEQRDTARAEGAKSAPEYRALRRSVRASTRLAMWLSEPV